MSEYPRLLSGELAAEYDELLKIIVKRADAEPTDIYLLEACVRLGQRYETLADFWYGISKVLRPA